LSIAAGSSRVFTRFCAAIGRPEWLQQEDWRAYQGIAAGSVIGLT
jgi:hypothetical protein